jgi:excinuclease ABC subunit B
MEGARGGAPPGSQLLRGKRRDGKRGEVAAAADLRPETLARQMKKLQGEMLKRARNLEFEEAARLRDEIERLKQLELGIA